MADRGKVLHSLNSCGFTDGIPNICEVTDCPYREHGAWCVHELAHDAGELIGEMMKEPPPLDHDAGEIIYDLQLQIHWINDNESHQFPGWGHTVLAMNRAIRKLREQEPVKPLFSRFYNSDILIYKCGVCEKEIGADGLPKYCMHCGREVKWE